MAATIYKYRITLTHEADAYDVNVQDVTVDNYQLLLTLGTIIKGDKGDDGDSAYQVAVDNGFVGTEAEWLESLKGEAGKDGEDGKDGKDGKDAEVTAANIIAALGYTPADDADIDAINGLIPAQASPQNQLADKSFVNSSIATSTAEFRGTYPSIAALEDVEADANDYAYVVEQDAAGNTVYNRYKYVAGTGWMFEYALNNSSFTVAEWAAIQSGITQSLVAKLSALPTNAELNTSLGNKVDKVQGKGLSTNDYTDADKAAVAAIPDELADLQDDATHRLVTDTEKNTWNAKQDTISDLSTIRSGAALGATAIQSETDPTVPHWAKQSTKPSYTASEVGAVPTGQGLPSGGSTGQVLKKASATDYDVEWANESGGGGISTLNIPVIPDLGEYNLGTKAQAATVLGITEAELDALMAGNYDRLVFENAMYADRTEAVHTYQSNVSVSYSYTGRNPLRFVFSTDGVEYFSLAERIVPALSTSISDDGSSNTKAATPKAVKDYVDDLPLPTSLGLFQFTPTESSSYISLGNAAAAATALSISESQLEILYEGGYNKVVLRDSVEGKICIGSESLVNSDATGIAYEIMSGDVTPYMLEFLYESSAYKYRYYQLQGGGSSDAVLYTAQTLTDSQKEQARTNIGAGTGGGTEHNLKVSPNSVIEVGLKHNTELIPNDTLISSRKIQIGNIHNIAAIYRTATYQRNYTINIYGQRVLLGLYQSETTFLRCFISVYNIKAQLQVNGTMVQDVTIGDARTLGINAYGDYAVAYDHNSRKFRLYSYSNNAITQVGEYDISSWDLSSITEVYPVTDVNNYQGHICCETIVINSPLHLDSYIAAPLNVGEYNVPSGTPYSGDICLAGTGLELDGTITQTISATDKIVTATYASENYIKLGPSNLGDDWQYMWYHVKLRFSSVSEGAYIKGATYFGEIVVESGGMPVAWIKDDLSTKWYPQADTDYDLYFGFSKNMGGSSKGQTYQRQYGLRLYGTVTMEVSEPFCFNPQVQNLCAETYNGAGFDGAIPFDGKCVFVPYDTGDITPSTMRIPIYTIRVDSNGKIYMWNGSVWKQINNS